MSKTSILSIKKNQVFAMHEGEIGAVSNSLEKNLMPQPLAHSIQISGSVSLNVSAEISITYMHENLSFLQNKTSK